MALSVYKLNDVLLSESGLPVTSSECLSFSKEYSSEDSFETITSFVYCYQTTAICKPSEAVSRSTPPISVFTSAVDASSSTGTSQLLSSIRIFNATSTSYITGKT